MIKPGPYTGPWQLADLKRIKPNGIKVFSTFACGGGSSMGYKLAGYDVIGALDLEKRSSQCYVDNLAPKHHFTMDIREFNKIKPPKELFGIDILDGSPPCSQFSTAGHREKNWGKKKMYGEGKTIQTVDDLFFHFIDTVALLKPKVVIAENVKGLVSGNAKGYVKEIMTQLRVLGYTTQLFLFNADRMGVPQSRQRVFFFATKQPREKLQFRFDEQLISASKACEGTSSKGANWITDNSRHLWENTIPGKGFNTVHLKGSRFNIKKLNGNKPSQTLPAMGVLTHWAEPRNLSRDEFIRISTFPEDYQFNGDNLWVNWICGMSVPPFMMQRIALEVGRQWFGLDYDKTQRRLSPV